MKILSISFSYLLLSACSTLPTPKTIDNIAIELCEDFFAHHPKTAKLSLTEIEQGLCATAEQIAPFLASAKAAEVDAGSKVVP